KITLQLKSLNSKKFDLYTRVPSVYREKELHLHKMISHALERGKINFSIAVENASGETTTTINHAVVKHYMEDLKSMSDTANTAELLKMAITLPDALKTEREEIDKKEFAAIEVGLKDALEKINQY